MMTAGVSSQGETVLVPLLCDGIEKTEGSTSTKVNRGVFQAGFFCVSMPAIGCLLSRLVDVPFAR